MQFLLDAISTSIHFTKYKVFEIDTDVYFVSTTTKWKEGIAPTDFYLSKIKWTWQTDVQVSQQILEDITAQLEHYLLSRKQEKERELRKVKQ